MVLSNLPRLFVTKLRVPMEQTERQAASRS